MTHRLMMLGKVMTSVEPSLLLGLLLLAACSSPQPCHASAADPPLKAAGGWRLGRATFYGGLADFTDVLADS